MKYKVGDTVRIRSKEWFDARDKNEEGHIERKGEIFASDMFDYAGQTARIIESFDNGNYYVDITGDKWEWAYWMFEPDYNPFKEPLSARDAIEAMLAGETLYDEDGVEYHFDHEAHCFTAMKDGEVAERAVRAVAFFDGLYRRPVKHKRTMTRWELLDWANSEASRGWVVCNYNPTTSMTETEWRPPQCPIYDGDLTKYWKARLLPDLSGIDESTIQGFEVEDTE
jgi:hypothetical protein